MWISKRYYNLLLENIKLKTEFINHLINENSLLSMNIINCKKDNLSSVYGMFKNIDFPNSNDKGVNNMK